MSEFEMLVAALERMGKSFKIGDNNASISCESGYIGFCVEMNFDSDGNLTDNILIIF